MILEIQNHPTTLTVITPAASSRLTTVDAFREEFGVASGAASDAQVLRWIDRSSAMAADYCSRVFAQEVVRQVDAFLGCSSILLERTPATAIVVTVDGTDLTAGVDYHHDPVRGALYRLRNGRPCVWRGLVQVDYAGGYVLPGNDGANLPGDVEYAVLLWSASFMGRATTATASGTIRREQIDGVGYTEYFDPTISTPPAGSALQTPQQLLAPYRRVVL